MLPREQVHMHIKQNRGGSIEAGTLHAIKGWVQKQVGLVLGQREQLHVGGDMDSTFQLVLALSEAQGQMSWKDGAHAACMMPSHLGVVPQQLLK